MDQVTIMFDRSTQPTATQTLNSLSDVIANPQMIWQREDPWSDFVQLLGELNVLNQMPISLVVDQFTIANGIRKAMAVLQLRQEVILCIT